MDLESDTGGSRRSEHSNLHEKPVDFENPFLHPVVPTRLNSVQQTARQMLKLGKATIVMP